MSSIISENVQLTVMQTADKKSLAVSINDYYANGGCISIYVQLTNKQALDLINLLNEKLPKHV